MNTAPEYNMEFESAPAPPPPRLRLIRGGKDDFAELRLRQSNFLNISVQDYNELTVHTSAASNSNSGSPVTVYEAARKEWDASFAISEPMLQWPDNWDGEGALAVKQETWNKMRRLLELTLATIWTKARKVLRAPTISPGPDGSIDVHWELDGRELLLNIPPSPDEPATFYGDNKFGEKVKGQLNPKLEQQWLFEWLTH